MTIGGPRRRRIRSSTTSTTPRTSFCRSCRSRRRQQAGVLGVDDSRSPPTMASGRLPSALTSGIDPKAEARVGDALLARGLLGDPRLLGQAEGTLGVGPPQPVLGARGAPVDAPSEVLQRLGVLPRGQVLPPFLHLVVGPDQRASLVGPPPL